MLKENKSADEIIKAFEQIKADARGELEQDVLDQCTSDKQVDGIEHHIFNAIHSAKLKVADAAQTEERELGKKTAKYTFFGGSLAGAFLGSSLVGLTLYIKSR